MTSEADFVRRFRPNLPILALLYIGVMFVISPYFIKTYYAEILATAGTILCILAIVTYWSQRIERRMSDLVAVQGRLLESGIDAVELVSRHNLYPFLQKIDQVVSVAINRDEMKLLLDLLRYLEDRPEPRRVIVTNWPSDSTRPDDMALMSWLRDAVRGADVRVSSERLDSGIIVSQRRAVLICPVNRERGVYLFSALSRWSEPGELLIDEVERVWSRATPYAGQQTTALS